MAGLLLGWGGGWQKRERYNRGVFHEEEDTVLSNPPIPYEIFALASHFHVYLPWVNICSEKCLNSVLNVNALVGTLNQEKVLVAFSVIADLCMDLRMFVKSFLLSSPPWLRQWNVVL